MTNFSDLGLDALLLQALAEAGHETPTPIQAQAIPAAMEGRDVLGIAQTGTGKTAAFALPILHRLKQGGGRPPRGGCRVLVLSPTRELASQIADSFRKYGRHLGFSTEVIFGGVGHVPQQKALARGVDVLVATPGRLLDHMGTRHARLDHVEVLVLDEADQMLDKGFLPPIRKIVAAVPQRQQTLFFSATMPNDIAALARDMLREPVRVEVTPVASTAERVNQRAILLEQGGKRAVLAKLLRGEGVGRTLIFSRTKHGADKIVKALEQDGLSANAIHGNKGQSQRERALAEFKSGKAPILVATDIAARGIDVREVTHVIQHDLPEVAETYVHRIGRTARAGAEGEAVALVAPDELGLLRAVERLTRQHVPMEDMRADKTGRLDDRATPVRPQRGQRPARDDGRGQRPGREDGGRQAGKPQGQRQRDEQPRQARAEAPRGPRQDAPRPQRQDAPRGPQRPQGGDAGRKRPGGDAGGAPSRDGGRVFMARGR